MNSVHFAEGRGFPNAAPVGRNTPLAGGTKDCDISLFKTFAIAERKHLEFHWEAFNVFNPRQVVECIRSQCKGLSSRVFFEPGLHRQRYSDDVAAVEVCCLRPGATLEGVRY